MSLRALVVGTVALLGVTLMAISPVGAVCFACGPWCEGCCPAGGGCVYSPTTDHCIITCADPGGGDAPPEPREYVPLCPWDDRPWECGAGLTTPGDEASTEGVGLDAMLTAVSSASGVPIIAPAVMKRTLPKRIARGDFATAVGAIAVEAGAVPVIRGSIDVIELVPLGDLEKRRFAMQPASASMRITAEFADTDLLRATRLIARQTRLDIVLPQGFSGRISGSFRDQDWKEVLQAVANASRSRGRLQVSPNGLVRIVP